MKRFNTNELIWFIILVAFTVYLYKIFNTGEISVYIHPRMFKYVYFSFVVFIILSVFQITRLITHEKNKKIKTGYLIFLIPLFFVFVINPEDIGAKMISNKGISLSNSNRIDIIDEQTNINNTKGVSSVIVYDKGINGSPQSNNPDIDNKDNNEFAEAEKFKEILTSSYERLDKIIGKEVELSGFVYRESDFDKNQFVIARLLMVCCAADTQITGILCEGNDSSDIADNEWIRITGIINSINYKDEYTKEEEIIPLIKVDRVENINVPKNQYIYP